MKICYDCNHCEVCRWIDKFKDIDICEFYEQGQNREPSGDLISRHSAIFLADDLKQDLPDDKRIADMVMAHNEGILEYQTQLSLLPSVKPQEPKTGNCKDCRYFEYDSVAKVDGIPLIVAHEICTKWGDGCKTKEDGYCFLFEPQADMVKQKENCDTCEHSDEIDGSNCYECVKGIRNNYMVESEESDEQPIRNNLS